MKRILLFVVAILFISIAGYSQNNVQLNIHHKLGDQDFAMNQAAQNNLGNDFKTTRMHYYLSELMVEHDGGVQTPIEDLWILVDASGETSVDLGSYDITVVEKIILHVGVDPDHNHLDPASYPASHPLSPKNPSMHWGWNPGYRFVTFEGDAGSNFNQGVEIHGLGDENYFATEIVLEATANNGEVNIDIDADYTRALENISVSSGLIVHSASQEGRTILENFRDYVFSPSETATSINENEGNSDFNYYPNPLSINNTTITISPDLAANYDLVVYDLVGKEVARFSELRNVSTLDLALEDAGIYLISIIQEGITIKSQQLIVR